MSEARDLRSASVDKVDSRCVRAAAPYGRETDPAGELSTLPSRDKSQVSWVLPPEDVSRETCKCQGQSTS